jgi:Flp pilus assembly protein TadD
MRQVTETKYLKFSENYIMASAFSRLAAACLLAAICACAWAQTTLVKPAQDSNDYQEATLLYRAGQSVKAMERIDAWLKQRPRDARGRFLKGMIFTQQKRIDDAVRVYTELTQDFPELPEPYNNLAVIHAGQGDYDRARGLLESAIRANASFAAAHENLGDIQLRLAARAYEHAAKLDPQNKTTANKLKSVNELLPVHAGK